MKVKALIIGGSVAILILGLIGLRNYQLELGARALNDNEGTKAIERFQTLAKLGDTKAQYLLGNIYAFGWAGITRDDEKAIYWFRRAAMYLKDEADPAAPAELEVAKSYADGEKVDKAESLKWLRLAASGGSKEAASMLTKLERH
jgi:uncharacterized protein